MSLHRVAAVLVDSAYEARNSSFNGDKEKTLDNLRIMTAAYNDMLYYLSGSDPVRVKQAAVGVHHGEVWKAVHKVFEEGAMAPSKFSKGSLSELKNMAKSVIANLATGVRNLMVLNKENVNDTTEYTASRKEELRLFSDNLASLSFVCGQILHQISLLEQRGGVKVENPSKTPAPPVNELIQQSKK